MQRNLLSKPFFVLAPMDDVTDTVFRQVVASCAAPDLYFTEFVNVDGLQSPGRSKLYKKLLSTRSEQPLIAQIWGKKPENFYQTAKELADGTFARELGLSPGINFAGIDLNFGCPDKTVVRNECCSALINNREQAVEIIKATQAGANGLVPISVKTRLGFNSIDLSWHRLLLQQSLNMLTIHGRTKQEMSKVPAHWDVIGDIVNLRDEMKVETLIVGNGDVLTRQQGLDLAQRYRLDGIMIGRGIFYDPFVFAQDSPWETYTKQQRIALYKKHVELFAATWKHDERRIHTLNKFCKIYINNFDGAKELREVLMVADSAEALCSILDQA
ncbi:MAG: tRNA-dihydrouridine synthase [Candidatus Saccharimonadales bacterium]